MGDLTGKTWFITGTSSGLGLAIAHEVLGRGGNVVASARTPENLANVFPFAPERVLVLSLDVTCPQQIAMAVSQAQERFGQINVLVNNAGYGLLAAIEEGSDVEVRRQFDVNVFGLAAVTRAVLPGMRAAGVGQVVNMSSTAATRGSPGTGYYAASKFAVEAISESLSREGEPLGIRVLIVEPGPFRTDFSGRSIAVPIEPIAAYEQAAQMRKYSDALDGSQPGDPKRAAKIIVDTVLAPDPPLRLVLGAKAYEGALQSIRERLNDMERSHHIAPQADFPNATPQDR